MNVEDLPADIDARRRLLRLLHGAPRPAELAVALEADNALLLRALRAANGLEGRAGTIGSAEQAVAALGAAGIADVAQRTPVQHPSRAQGLWGELPRRHAAHVEAVRRVAGLLRRTASGGDPGELTAAVLLHDIGRVALWCDEPGYDRLVPESGSPEDRVRCERAAFGHDHAEVGGALARRWRLPERLAVAIEEHHGTRLGTPALVRLADMLVHAREGQLVDLARLSELVAVVGVAPSEVRTVAFDAAA